MRKKLYKTVVTYYGGKGNHTKVSQRRMDVNEYCDYTESLLHLQYSKRGVDSFVITPIPETKGGWLDVTY